MNMEKVKLFGESCYRIKNEHNVVTLENVVVYDYDNQPDEIAHWLKLTKKWQVIPKEKTAIYIIKLGNELVLKKGYLYGDRKLVEKVIKRKEGAKHPREHLLKTILGLVQLNVLNKEQGKERLLRHIEEEQAEEMLQSI